jgi:hypothetical protein
MTAPSITYDRPTVTNRLAPVRRRRARGISPGSGTPAHGRLGSVLALQRMAGNRAVRALIARDAKVIKVGDEQVRVASDAEKGEAERIIKDVKANFGVTFDSMAAKKATLEHYPEGDVRPEARKALDVRPWEMDELRAVQKALKYFAPVLGDQRRKSTLKGTAQEITSAGRLTSAPDDEPDADETEKTRGQYFGKAQAFAVFDPAKETNPDRGDLERVATHEIAHGIFEPRLEEFMKATGYWERKLVRKPAKERKEGPPDSYADRNAAEDLAQSVMYYFIDPKRLLEGRPGRAKGTWGNPCPKRHAFIKKVVAGWTKKG